MMRHSTLILVLVLHLLLLAGYSLASDDDPIERYEQHDIAASSSSSEASSTTTTTTTWEVSSSANSFVNSETNSKQDSRRGQQHSLIRGPKPISQIDTEIVPLQSSSSDLLFELDSCSSHQDCYNCSQTTRCHWCQHDQQCHLMGSIHGCVIGEQCNNNDNNNNHHRGTSDSCSVYQNCSSCSATRTCHWCAHDEACHLIGSVYGCVRGVDCFAEDRCRREIPEPLAASFTNMDRVALMIVGLVGGVAILILSCCFCLACGVKGSYDDLMTVVSQGQQHQHQHQQQIQHQQPNLFLVGSISTHPEHHRHEGEVAAASETTELLEAENNDTETPSSSDASLKAKNNPQNGEEIQQADSSQETNNLEEGTGNNEYFYQALEEEQQHQYQQQPTQEDSPLLPTTSLISHAIDEAPPRIHGSKHARRMIGACSCIYFLMVAIIGGLVVGAVRLFPKIPEYSVCNDSVAWKKLFDGLVKLKTEVDFEILMSIENANHIDVALDQGKGIFRHDDAVVGHYTVPPVLAPAMSIIDILVLGTLTPDRGQAIALAKEYYQGQLILDVDAALIVRSPSFFNVSKQVNVTGRKVDINAAQDRHLCNCKDWDSNSTTFAANFVSATLGDFYKIMDPLTDFRDS